MLIVWRNSTNKIGTCVFVCPRVTQCVSIIISSLLSCSNSVVQVKAVESGALQTLLTLLATTHPLRVRKKVLAHIPMYCGEGEYTNTYSSALMSSVCDCRSARFSLQWPPSYATSPMHNITSCHMEGCRSYRSCSGRMKAGFCVHALLPCCMT